MSFPIKGIREHVTNKLQEIALLKRYSSEDRILQISETERQKKPSSQETELLNIKICEMPNNNIWVFENEFDKQFQNQNQRSAFTSAGKKVEKTIFYYDADRYRLYLIMVEMKTTISPQKMKIDVSKKFEQSLSTLSVFISAHIDFPRFENAELYPIGVCCYNYYEAIQLDDSRDRDPKSIARIIEKEYSQGNRKILINIEPLGLNRMKSPVLFFENPNRDPVTDSFSIKFENMIQPIINF